MKINMLSIPNSLTLVEFWQNTAVWLNKASVIEKSPWHRLANNSPGKQISFFLSIDPPDLLEKIPSLGHRASGVAVPEIEHMLKFHWSHLHKSDWEGFTPEHIFKIKTNILLYLNETYTAPPHIPALGCFLLSLLKCFTSVFSHFPP